MQVVLALVGVLIGSLVSTGTAMLLYRRQQRDIRDWRHRLEPVTQLGGTNELMTRVYNA